MNSKNQLIAIVILGIILVMFGNKILNEILQALGLKDDDEESAAKGAQKSANNTAVNLGYFRPAFTESEEAAGCLLLTTVKAKEFSNQINKAIGYFSDNPEEIESVFNQLKTKSQVSFLARQFQSTFGKDLYSFLQDKLDTEHQREVWQRILDYTNKLPSYRPR